MPILERLRNILGIDGLFSKAAPILAPGTVIDQRYEVGEFIGGGSFGEVYRGRHLALERDVAIKALSADVAASAAVQAAFLREARLLVDVDHPNAATVFDYGLFGGRTPYLVMELVAGRSLAAVLKDLPGERMEPERALRLFECIAGALAHAHERNIVHLDLKPQNVMLPGSAGRDEEVRLVDFGLSRLVETAHERDEQASDDAEGVIAGTPGHMAPEQIRREPLDLRADIYGLAVTLYRTLAGASPWPGAGGADLLRAQLRQPPRPLAEANPAISREASRVVMKALSVDRDDRHASVEAFIEEFARAVRGPDGGRARGSRGFSMAEVVAASGEAEAELDRGQYARCFQRCDGLIRDGIADPQLIQIAVLALARSGAAIEAERYFESHAARLPEATEYQALRARLLKDRAWASAEETERAHWLRRALAAYRQTFEASGSEYVAINVATLSLLTGDRDEACALARSLLDGNEARDYWSLATRAEASLILGDVDAAKALLARARAIAPIAYSWHQATRGQLRRLCAALGIDGAVLSPLAAPAILYVPVSGPADALRAAALQHAGSLRSLVGQHEAAEALLPLRGPADLAFAEALATGGCAISLLLPCPAPMLRSSVEQDVGAEGVARLDRMLEGAARVWTAGDSNAEACDEFLEHLMRGMALLRARELEADVLELCVGGDPPMRLTAQLARARARERTQGSETVGGNHSICAIVMTFGRIADRSDRELQELRSRLDGLVRRIEQDHVGARAMHDVASVSVLVPEPEDASSIAMALASIARASPLTREWRLFAHAAAAPPAHLQATADRVLLQARAMAHGASAGSIHFSERLAALAAATDETHQLEFGFAGSIELGGGWGELEIVSVRNAAPRMGSTG